MPMRLSSGVINPGSWQSVSCRFVSGCAMPSSYPALNAFGDANHQFHTGMLANNGICRKGAGTKSRSICPVAFTASSTVSKHEFRQHRSSFPGEIIPTIGAVIFHFCRVNAPSRPVMPCTSTFVSIFIRILIIFSFCFYLIRRLS